MTSVTSTMDLGHQSHSDLVCGYMLRTDLEAIPTSSSANSPNRSRLLIVDNLTGRFVRVSSHIWQSLVSGTADEATWQLAKTAGWTVDRSADASASDKKRINPLFIQIPVHSVDAAAKFLANHSACLFGKAAVRLWFGFMIVTAAMLCGQTFAISQAFADLPQFFRQTSPVMLGCVIVVTKLMHELAHATVCRRQGAACGSIGVILMCGFPCPYCDVTQSYRVEQMSKRIAVMLAGIYIEWIIASLAAWVFVLSDSSTVQLHAFNVMIVCGISTLVFNANPLMRYDGYYVLADWLGSVNLRQEAKSAFARFIGGSFASIQQRCRLLAAYHLLAVAYRTVVMVTVVYFLFSILAWMQLDWLQPILAIAVLFIVARTLFRKARHVIVGTGEWRGASALTRGLIGGGSIGLIVLIALFPIPRRSSVDGYLDARHAREIHLGVHGVIGTVYCDYGNSVIAGQSLVHVENTDDTIEELKWESKVRLASLRSRLVRQSSIDSPSSTAGSTGDFSSVDQWETIEAAESSARENLASVRLRSEKSTTLAPVSGIILPPRSVKNENPIEAFSLQRRAGQRSDPGMVWCRIASDDTLSAILEVDAANRKAIRVGTPVRIQLAGDSESSARVVQGSVQSISSITSTPESIRHDASFQIVCSVPPSTDRSQAQKPAGSNDPLRLISRIGQQVHATIELPAESLFESSYKRLRAWLDSMN